MCRHDHSHPFHGRERSYYDTMSYTRRDIYYFDRPGPENTGDAARMAVERAKALGIRRIVVASTGGSTALAFLGAVKGTGIELIVVTHVVGFEKPGAWEFSEEAAGVLRAAGARIVTGTHALSGLERALSRAQRVGGGECTLIAADQGAIPVSEEVVAAGGTMSGADTVCVIRPAHTASFFDLQVREIVAMPRNR
jgi:hypothetical protein